MSNYDPWTYEPSEEELIAMYANASDYGGVYGKTPANRLNFLQDIEQSLGIPITQLLGGSVPADPLPPPPLPGVAPLPPSRQFDVPIQSEQRAVFGSNPTISQMYDLIDQGADPYTVAEKFMPQVPLNPEDMDEVTLKQIMDQRTQFQRLATDYAFERQQMGQDRARQEAEYANQYQDYLGEMSTYQAEQDRAMAEYEQQIAGKQPTYTLPSGKKLTGQGTDIMGFQNEWELLGAPEGKDLVDAVARSRSSSTMTRAPGTPRSSANRAEFEAVNVRPKGGFENRAAFEASQPPQRTGRPTQGKVWTAGPSDKVKAMAQPLIDWEIGKRKNTMVRSDANKDAMLRILGLRAIAGI